MSFQVLGRVLVILGSTKATKDLLEKRAGVYSDRPVIPFFEMYALESDKPPIVADTAQDGCAVESTVVEIWFSLASSAQDCRTGFLSRVPGRVPYHPRDKSSCSHRAPVAKSAGMDGAH
jgi:hypothetical protein